MGFQSFSVWLCSCSHSGRSPNAASVELGHDWNFLRVWLCSDTNGKTRWSSQRLRNFMAKLFKSHLVNTENPLCFIFLLLSANCSFAVQTSVIFISFIEIESISLLAGLDTLTFERCTTDFGSSSIRSKKEQFWTIVMMHLQFVPWLFKCSVYLAILLWIYRLFLFRLQREVEKIVAVAWNIFQPFLFGLIGAEVSVMSLRPETVGKIIH